MPAKCSSRGTCAGDSYWPALHPFPHPLTTAPAFFSLEGGTSWLSLQLGVPVRCQLKSLSGGQGDVGGSLKGATPHLMSAPSSPPPCPIFQPSLSLGSGRQARNWTASPGGTSQPGPPSEAPGEGWSHRCLWVKTEMKRVSLA